MKSIYGHRVQVAGLIVGRIEKLPAGEYVNITKVCQKLDLNCEWMETCTRKESLFPFAWVEIGEEYLIPVAEYPAWLVSVLVIDDLPLALQHHAHHAVMDACRELMKGVKCYYQRLHLIERYFISAELVSAHSAA